jgi:hypothetical protein
VLVTIASGQTRTDINPVLQRGGAIAGRIVDGSGQPIVDARVSALQRAPNGRPQGVILPAGPPAQTNDLGEFRVYGLPAGEYYIQAAPRADSLWGNGSPRTTTMAVTFYPNAIDVAAASPIPVGAGQTVNDILVTMLVVPAYQISGIVVDESGQPVADAMIMLAREAVGGVMPMGPPVRARSDASGQFVIPNVTGGMYIVSAAAPVVSSSAGRTDGTVSAPSGGTISGTAGGGIGAWSAWETRGNTTVQYQANPGAGLHVTVNDASVGGLQIAVSRAR